MLFHLVVHKDNDSTYGVTVPALEGCFSVGDTLEEAVAKSKEAILFHLEGSLNDGIEPIISNPTLNDLRSNPDYQDGLLVSVDIDVSQYTLKPERFNVSWPKNILRQVDKHVAKTNDTRSNFLLNASLNYIQIQQKERMLMMNIKTLKSELFERFKETWTESTDLVPNHFKAIYFIAIDSINRKFIVSFYHSQSLAFYTPERDGVDMGLVMVQESITEKDLEDCPGHPVLLKKHQEKYCQLLIENLSEILTDSYENVERIV